MKRIMAIGTILILGMLIVPNISNVTAVQQTYYELNPGNGEQGWIREQYPNRTWNDYNYFIVTNATGASEKGLLRFKTNQIHPDSTIVMAKLRVYTDGGLNGANVSIHAVNDNWVQDNVTWITRIGLTNETGEYNNRTWVNTGGDYNSTIIDTVYFDQDETWYEFDITTIYRDWVNNGTKNFGLIFVSYDSATSSSTGIYGPNAAGGHLAKRPRLNLTYIGFNEGKSTTIIKDIWNLEGYANATTKNASTLYSEITNCTALSGKNATTGYWYTYWPEYGIVEDFDVEFGDGLFILTSADTTWDHT